MGTNSILLARTRKCRTVRLPCVLLALYILTLSPTRVVIYNTERVVASNVFEEKDFPSMVSGRVVLLGDGMLPSFHQVTNSSSLAYKP